MKVTLQITLDLPDTYASCPKAELGQLLFDQYVNYVTSRHAADAVHWCALSRAGSANEDASKKRIFEDHANWREIASTAVWSFDVAAAPVDNASLPDPA